jgi:hypothetical protein
MTERPLSYQEQELIKDCYWAVNQNTGDIEKCQAMLDFYSTACPIQLQALLSEIASYGEDD